MRSLCFIFALLLTSPVPAMADVSAHDTRPENKSINALERRLMEIDAELKQLASYTLRGDTGAVGYRSRLHEKPDIPITLRIDLEKESLIDEVVLVPALWRESEVGLLAEGFPLAFKIVAGTEGGEKTVASRSTEDRLLPRIAPLAIHFPPVKASWLRIEVSNLSHRFMDGEFMLQLAEIMVFSGRENVALGQNVHASEESSHPWHPSLLTDGFTPYLMDAAHGERSQTQLIHVRKPDSPLYFTIDLLDAHPVNQINFHAADTALSIPMRNFGDVGVPRQVRVMGSMRSDFSDGFILCDYEQLSIDSNGPIIMRRFGERACRYVRIEIVDHRPIVSEDKLRPVIGFSEIEVIADGTNAARGRPPELSPGLSAGEETQRKITDGLNYYGTILPVRDWMSQLSRRHDLEKERPLVVGELSTRYARQKAHLQIALWVATLLAVSIVFIFLLYGMIHQRRIIRIKERFAADLHDELGANLHTIGLLSDLAEEAKRDPGELSAYLERIRAVSERSGRAMRNMVDMHESKNLFMGLKTDMQHAADRIVANQFHHELTLEGEANVAKLSPQTRIDLYLFYKECLINACRHSEASHVSTRLVAGPEDVTLIITDNGRGLPTSPGTDAPPSLKRRAKLLKAKLTAERPAEGGTRITLRIHSGRGWLRVFRCLKPPAP